MGFHEAFCDQKSLIQILNLKSEKIMHNAVHSVNEYCENGTYQLHDQEEKK